ncbi:Glucose dehydrogenase [Eumeta japonica]|uniref:Glucose dehydrogenase n=1 Tax=Eumeta variegata TaxID=151549 RepID=A0A4C1XCL5_EUMVA|nr:Glucose dehydrogenase [Eumeta japonica]
MPDSSTVLLLEAGGDEPIPSAVPGFYRSYWNNPEVDWMYRTQPQDDVCLDQGAEGCMWPRGKVLGGTSVLNGMMYHRGHKADYDDWVRLYNATGWSWDEVREYFDRTESNKQVGTLVKKENHGTYGPMPIQHFKYQPQLGYDILEAAREAGFPVVSDMNDPNTAEGFTVAQAFNNNGSRYSTSRAYLRPASRRANLDVTLHAQVTKLLFNGDQVVGVVFVRNGQKHIVQATKEVCECIFYYNLNDKVILSAGALNTPQILLLSGIGPKETLLKHNIPIVADLPQVGRNLRNHLGVNFYFLLENDRNTRTLDWSAATDYLLNREGVMTSTGITQVTGLLYSRFGDRLRQQPDLQFFFNGPYPECSRTGTVAEPISAYQPDAPRSISFSGIALLPRSVGYLTLRSSDPLEPPLFYPNYFDHPDDMQMLKDSAQHIRNIVETNVFRNKWGIRSDPAYTSRCLRAGPEWSDEYVACMARQYTDPQNHQCGTAALGLVVDPRLRVYNVKGVRVMDASVMPFAPTGNPQAAIMMVAEKGVAMLKEDWASFIRN